MGGFRILFVFVLAGSLAGWIGCTPALAEKRVALVIGNSAYTAVQQLANPVNDATLVGAMFTRAGFDSVDVRLNLNASDMRKSFRDFGSKTRDADVAVIYYAGHGIELDGNNYLIPTDATLETDADVLDETLSVDRALFTVEPAKQLRLIILDACRDNPFAKKIKRTMAARAIGRGLAKVEPNSPNTMIAFAAKAGSIALDGDNHSPFAIALVDHLPKPGLDLRKAFGFVRDDVLKNTNYKQEPYVYGSLGGDDVPLVPARPMATGAQPNPQDTVRKDYELALQAGDRDAWEAFLRSYPAGFYSDLAKVQLKKIAAEEARAAAAEKARLAAEEARLAADRAKKAEQDKAAEGAQILAEKTKQIEQAKADAAEQRRAKAEAAAAKALAEKQAAEKALADREAAEKAKVELATKEPAGQKEAALAPSPPEVALSPQELSRQTQDELRRVGCLADAVDGDWNSASQRSLALFNNYAGTTFDTTKSSSEALDALKSKQGRVCPLICDYGSRADGDRCVKITCRAGYRLGDHNECEKGQRKTGASRDELKARDLARKQAETASPKRQATGQIVCTQAGCRPVRSGCRLERKGGYMNPMEGTGIVTREVCN